VESEPQKGTCFSVSLPLLDEMECSTLDSVQVSNINQKM